MTLTVTDNLGLSASATAIVKVLDQYNTYPCQTSFTLLQASTCLGNNGRLRINNAPATIALWRLPDNAPMPPTNGNEYQNLPAGGYLFTASGTGGCRDTFQLIIPRYRRNLVGSHPVPCALPIRPQQSRFPT